MKERIHLKERIHPWAFEMHCRSLTDVFDELRFFDKAKTVLRWLRKPKDSGEYKLARFQLTRLQSPAAAVVIPILLVLLAGWLTLARKPEPRPFVFTMPPPRKAPVLEPLPPLQKPEIAPVELPTADVQAAFQQADIPEPEARPGAGSEGLSALPGDVLSNPSKFAMPGMRPAGAGLLDWRTPEKIGQILAEQAPTGAGDAIYRALRWLKKNQNDDGSWGTEPVAFTAMAVLTFLAHGETPSSPEFGRTVEKGIKRLLNSQLPDGRFGARTAYRHQLATYALCEAYTMTGIPPVKEAAEKGLDAIIGGQNPAGGWNYELKPCERNDLSVGAWCVQALKAARIARLRNDGLEQCMKRSLDGARNNYSPAGGFGYTGPGVSGLTGAGALWMQLMGAPDSVEVRTAMSNKLAKQQCVWENVKWNTLYYWYYDTQAVFHHGGEPWKRWEGFFMPALLHSQIVTPKAIMGPDGTLVDIGHWSSASTKGEVMDTCLCALMLQVYYRYLPTYRSPEPVREEARSDPGDVRPTVRDAPI